MGILHGQISSLSSQDRLAECPRRWAFRNFQVIRPAEGQGEINILKSWYSGVFRLSGHPSGQCEINILKSRHSGIFRRALSGELKGEDADCYGA